MIEAYLRSMRQDRKSELTIKNNEYILKNFFSEYGEPNKQSIDSFKSKKRGKTGVLYTPQTENTIRSVLRSYLRFVGKVELAKTIKNVRIPRTIPFSLTTEQTKTLLGTKVQQKPELQQRDKLILEFFYSTGCRVSELNKMNQSDLSFDDGSARVRGGKGSIDRDVTLSKDWIEEYIKTFGEIDLRNPKPLFSNFLGKRISVRWLREIVRMASEQSGVTVSESKLVSPHKLRSTFATRVYEGSGDIYSAKEALGHSKIETTLRYARFDKERLKKIKNPLDELKK